MNPRVTFHKALPNGERTDQFDLNPSIHKLSISTQLPGGYDTCIIGLNTVGGYQSPFPYFPAPQDVVPRGHVVIKMGQFLAFEGAIVKIKYKGGQIVEVTVRGYWFVGLNDNWYRDNSVNVSSSVAQIQSVATTAGQIIASAVLSAAPLVKLGLQDTEYSDPGLILVPGSFYGQTPAQIIEAVTKAGGPLNIVWDSWLYEDRALHLQPRLLKGPADYSIPLDDSVEWIDDYGNIAGSGRVEFQLPDWDHADKDTLTPDHNGNYQTGDATNTDFVDRYGFDRSVYVKAGTLTAGVANQFRDTNLAYHFDPEVTATITRDKMRGMELGTGSELPSYMAQAAQWVKVAGKSPLVIVRTKWDWPEHNFECELGKSAQKWETLISFLQEIARHTVMGTNPLSGARS